MEWISIKDKLPNENQDVIFYCERYPHLIAIGNSRKEVIVYAGARYRVSDEVTHWMPLPKPPTINPTK